MTFHDVVRPHILLPPRCKCCEEALSKVKPGLLREPG